MSVMTRLADSRVRGWVGTVVRVGLAVVWGWAGWSKMRDPRGFTQTVRAYDATPEWLSKTIGYGLPVLELCVAALLLFGAVTRLAASVSALLFVVFLVGLVQASARGIKLECGCFGGGGTTTAPTHYTLDILRDVGLLVLAVFLVLWPMTQLSVDEAMAREAQVAMPSAKRMRTEEGRRKYNAVLEARRKEVRSRQRYLALTLSILIVLVGVIGIGVQANRAKIAGVITADNADVQNGVTVGSVAPATVDIFEDFQCPICNAFEQSAGADIAADIAAHKVQAKYHMMAFLDASSNGAMYSTRAANAALCASDDSVAMFQKYHNYLYSKVNGVNVQPAEGGNGRTDADFINYGKTLGISGTDLESFTSCVQDQTHKALVEAITDNASKRGVSGTPTVFVNGKKLATVTKATLDAAIAAAVGSA